MASYREGQAELVDPRTGRIEHVSGECAPLEHNWIRPLQRASGGLFWAAIPSGRAPGLTLVGGYDAESLHFEPMASYCYLDFTSSQMWVDESAGAAYVLSGQELLRMPLPQAIDRRSPGQMSTGPNLQTSSSTGRYDR